MRDAMANDQDGKAAGKKKVAEKLTQFTQGKNTYRVNDCCLVRGENVDMPFVGKIKDITQSGRTVKVQMAWFYRPEEAQGGRKAFHGERELFRSDHTDWALASTIQNKCRVHNLKAYQALKKVDEEDFFARFTYVPTSHEYRPDKVPVYCICEMPYNPDLFMVMCNECEEWYHPKCLGYEVTELPDAFICNDCKKAQAAPASKKHKSRQ